MLRVVVPTILTLLLLIGHPAVAATKPPTPRLAEGPYYPVAKPVEVDADLTRIGRGPRAKGRAIVLRGRVIDTAGRPIPGAKLEIWQADYRGIHMHPRDRRTAERDKAFQFYGVAIADAKGEITVRSILPGTYGGRPRHLHAKITPPKGATLTTQFYLKTGALMRRDGILRLLGRSAQRITINLRRTAGTRGPLAGAFTVVISRGRRR